MPRIDEDGWKKFYQNLPLGDRNRAIFRRFQMIIKCAYQTKGKEELILRSGFKMWQHRILSQTSVPNSVIHFEGNKEYQIPATALP